MSVALVLRARDGGVQRVNVDLANLLRRSGVRVSLVMARASGDFLAELEPGVDLVDLGAGSHLGFLLRFTRYLRHHRHDRILASQQHVAALAVLARFFARSPTLLVAVIHTHLTHELRQSVLARLYAAIFRRLFRHADRFVCVSEGVRIDLRSYLPASQRDVRVIYNAVSIPRLHSLAGQPCLEPWLERKEIPVLVGVGRLVGQKDFATLLRALSLLRSERPVRLLLVGDGALRSSLGALAKRLGVVEHVRFAGHVTNPYPLIRRADALVVSSAWEGFSLVILEALALGVPVVATDCESGPAEILDGGRFGRLAAVGDARGLANAIAETLAGEGRPDLGVQRAAEFSEDRFLRSYLEVLGMDAP